MKVAFLGPAGSEVLRFLRASEQAVEQLEEPVDADGLARRGVEFVVSHGYRHVLEPAVVARWDGRAINLHISYLPWNRGADPNLWSFLEDTPAGVSIHYIDEGLDTGDIVAREQLSFSDDETLASTYATLQRQIASLFVVHWPALRGGAAPRRPQSGDGSYHRTGDKEPYEHLLTNGWLTRIGALRGAALKTR